MTIDDLPEVLAIEQQTVAPWSARQLASELTTPKGSQFVLHESAGQKIIAFTTGTLAAGEAEIRKLAVTTQKRRSGAASFLLRYLFSYLEKNDAEDCYLELRGRNLVAMALYKGLGFRKTGLRKRYYTDPCDDAVLMHRLLRKLTASCKT